MPGNSKFIRWMIIAITNIDKILYHDLFNQYN